MLCSHTVKLFTYSHTTENVGFLSEYSKCINYNTVNIAHSDLSLIVIICFFTVS